MSLLQMSFSGAILILGIIVVRRMAINKLPKKIFIALWAVALIRLLFPFSVPSAFSVYSLLQDGGNAGEAAQRAFGANLIPVAQTRLPAMELSERLDGLQAEAYSPAWVILWAIGALSLAVLFMVSYLRCNREFQMSLPVENNFTAQWLQEHRRLRTVQIRQSERIAAPLTYGIFRPVILMPKNTDWENGRQLQYVLAHELVHICRFDGALKLIMALALCIHWFNPLVWIMYMLFNRDIELACDESVIRLFGENARSAYAFTLINMEEKKSGILPLCNNFSRNAIEERIVSIMKTKSMKTKRVTVGAVFAGILIIVGMAAVFTTSVKKDNAWRRTILRKLLRNRSCKKRIILRKAGSSCRKVEGDCGCSGKAWSEFYSADETVKALKTDGNR